MEDLVILGTGPAGLTAAIYAARANLNPLCVEGIQPGGQLTITTDVENYPGFPKGIMGPELMQSFKGQAERFGTRFLASEIVSADLRSHPFKLTDQSNHSIEAKSLIISTGASAKLLGLPNESRLMGHGVSACATCDGFFFKDVPIAVVGGGDTAMEEALFLTKFASKVIVIHRRDRLRASQIMAERAKKNPKIEFLWDTVVTDVLGEKEVESIALEHRVTKEKSSLEVKGLFIAIGHQPNTSLFKDQLKMNDAGYLDVTPGTTKTAIPGVFAAGDVADSVYRQAVTAAGTGCMAAIDAERYLAESELQA